MKTTRASLEFKPQDFVSYLTDAVGFTKPDTVPGSPALKRPLLLFTRPDPTQPIITTPQKVPPVRAQDLMQSPLAAAALMQTSPLAGVLPFVAQSPPPTLPGVAVSPFWSA